MKHLILILFLFPLTSCGTATQNNNEDLQHQINKLRSDLQTVNLRLHAKMVQFDRLLQTRIEEARGKKHLREDPVRRALVIKLIKALPIRTGLLAVRNSQREKNVSKERAAMAEKLFEQTRKAIVPLRKNIVIASSIFDYPGLIGRGITTYDERKKEYSLILGIFLGSEGRGDSEFRVIFNELGSIRVVDQIDYKH